MLTSKLNNLLKAFALRATLNALQKTRIETPYHEMYRRIDLKTKRKDFNVSALPDSEIRTGCALK